MPAKKFDPKAKAKRQKMIAAGGAVLLLALLAIQVPRTMKMLNAQSAAEPAVDIGAPIGSSDPSVLPTPGAAAGADAPAAEPGAFSDSDPAPVAETGQLVAFGRFASKDPFVQQIDRSADASAGAAAGEGDGATEDARPSSGGSTAPAASTPTGGGAVAPGAAPAPSTGGAAPSTGALISVNGAEEAVAVGADFPKDAPVFKLVSLTRAGAKIAIAGGAFASGERTLTLPRGKTVTLVNTADGARYELKLVR